MAHVYTIEENSGEAWTDVVAIAVDEETAKREALDHIPYPVDWIEDEYHLGSRVLRGWQAYAAGSKTHHLGIHVVEHPLIGAAG